MKMGKIYNSIFIIIFFVLFSSCDYQIKQWGKKTNEDSMSKALDELFKDDKEETFQSEFESQIKNKIENLNKVLPKASCEIISIVDYYHKDNKLYLKGKCSPEFIKPSTLQSNPELGTKEMIENLKYQIWEGDTLLKSDLLYLINEAKFNEFIIFNVEDPLSYRVSLNKDNLLDIINVTKNPTKDAIITQINNTNNYLPIDVDEKTRWLNMEIKNGFLIFNYLFYEGSYSIDYINSNKSEFKSYLRNRLFSEANNDLMHKAKSLGLGYEYHYIGDKSNKEISIYFQNDELK